MVETEGVGEMKQLESMENNLKKDKTGKGQTRVSHRDRAEGTRRVEKKNPPKDWLGS